MRNSDLTILNVQRVTDGRAWYQVLDRDGKVISAGWQNIAWRGEWQPGVKAHKKPVYVRRNVRKKPVYQPKS